MNNVAVTPSTVPPRRFRFVGGSLCLDFCNSVGGKRGVRTRECLKTYGDLLSWWEQTGLITSHEMATMARAAARSPALPRETFRRAIALREAIYRIFRAVMERGRPLEKDLSQLNAELARSLHHLRIVSDKNGFRWDWAFEKRALDQPLGPIARSAAELLLAEELRDRVRQCHGDNCGWLFIDSSKNHSRCWCDMRDCGNRAKVRRHRLRQKPKSEKTTAPGTD